ncbi:CynX/NimT family MFS transporter [Streptomyces sioyaensis]|uniref:CynX/NimT family MFS transporter n=1 Tax=Streptomyces sioyaensis TaxID=67364 RepID=UPI0037D7216E
MMATETEATPTDAKPAAAPNETTPTLPTATSGRLRAHPALAILGVVLASLSMRPALSGASPLLGEISRHFHLAATGSSLVTTLPLVFMGLGSTVAPKLARRWGTETVLCAALVLQGAGILLRVAPALPALFVGCMLIGAAIAPLNVLMPGLIKRDFPGRVTGMTALYSTALTLGATLSAATAVPLEQALGSWQGSLASCAIPVGLAAAAWFAQAAHARSAAATSAHAAPVRTADIGAHSPKLTRTPLAWQITLFMGAQSLVTYVLIAWLPTIFTDHGMSKAQAGLVFAFSALVQAIGTFVVPVLAGRMRSQRLLAVGVVTLMASGISGLLIAPAAGAWLWAALCGLGQGGALGLALTMMVLRTHDAHTAARLSGMAQTWGYLLAAIGPFALGAMHQATGGWNLPIMLLLVVCAGLAVLGLGAGRDRKI